MASASYNVSSITDINTGEFTITWDTDFSSAVYVAEVTVFVANVVVGRIGFVRELATTGTHVQVAFISDTSGGATVTETNVTAVLVTAYGDQ